MRKTSGAIVCPRCERLIDASEPKCPYCGAWQPGMYGFGPGLQKWLGGGFDLSNAITIACAVLYVLSLALDPAAIFPHGDGGGLLNIFNLLAPSGVALFKLGMTGRFAIANGGYWTVCTAIFLHGSLLHILFNMVIMRRYLPIVVDLFGNVRAFIIFMAAGILGFVLSSLLGSPGSIGASGSIFGLLGALISYGRRTGQSQVTNQLWTMAIAMFVMSFLMGGHVDNWAHAGGFAGGWLTAQVMSTSHRREGPGLIALAGGLAFVTVAGFVLSFVRFSALIGG